LFFHWGNEGLLKKVVSVHWGLQPHIIWMAIEEKNEAYIPGESWHTSCERLPEKNQEYCPSSVSAHLSMPGICGRLNGTQTKAVAVK
jgi:hypothetical protein